MANQLLTVKELCAWLEVEKTMVYRLVRQRKIPFFQGRIGLSLQREPGNEMDDQNQVG